MKLLLVEDEPQAVERLQYLLRSVRPDATILAVTDSVGTTVDWLNVNPAPDLILLDIHLADGLSFEIFEVVKVTSPVIFTTAYDEYALKAFKVNSIDYLLKPVDEPGLQAAFSKMENLQSAGTAVVTERIAEAFRQMRRRFKERFLVNVGERLISVPASEILFFVSEDKATYLHTQEHRNLLIDFALDVLESHLDPEVFFRINRKYIVSRNAIQDMRSHSNSRIRLVLSGTTDTDIIVARERVADFRAWLDH